MYSKSEAISTISNPIRFRCGLNSINRTLKSAMTERLCTYDEKDLNERGKPTKGYQRLYKLWGEGQIGIIVLGNIPVQRESLEAKGNLIIDKDSTWDPIEALKPIIKLTKSNGSLVIGQLTHAGRQTPIEINPNPVSASDTQSPDCFGMSFGKARALTIDEIKDIVDRFGYAAEVLYKAGADGAQLHCAHGYLLSQFLSPRVNKRTDNYGGSLENRSRIIFEIIEEIKRRVFNKDSKNEGQKTKFIISIKYNSHDFIDGGFTIEDSEILAKRIEEVGVELIELSGGTYENLPFFGDENRPEEKESTTRREGFFIEFAKRIRPNLKGSASLAVTGGFRTLRGISSALRTSNLEKRENEEEGLLEERNDYEGESKVCDIVGFGRPIAIQPDFVKDLLDGKVESSKFFKVPVHLEIRACYYVFKKISEDDQLIDLSDEETAKKVVEIISKP